MEQDSFAKAGSLKIVATKLVDLGDTQRKDILMSFDTDTRIRIIEEMVNIRITRGRKDDA
jgi:hypothetical protein